VRRHLRRTLLTIPRVAAHATLDRDAQSHVRALVDRLQFAVLAIDERGRYLAASAGAPSLTGSSQSELLTMRSSRPHLIPLHSRASRASMARHTPD
jgi:PAS domain-containing protein